MYRLEIITNLLFRQRTKTPFDIRCHRPIGNGYTHLLIQVKKQIFLLSDELLDLFRLDREWNDSAAKAQLMTIFEALKPTDPIVLKGRRRLSSMIFA